MKLHIGTDRIGVAPAPRAKPPPDHCPLDGERGVFRRMALLCPRCGRLLGGL